MSLIPCKRLARALSLDQLREFSEWLSEFIKRAEEVEPANKSSTGKQTVAERTLGNKTYRLEGIRCGKEKCRCARGRLHGPYWYSYFRLKDKVTSEYIGKKLPKDIEKKLKNKNEVRPAKKYS
jgi:Family of unknown function (DUF6788)